MLFKPKFKSHLIKPEMKMAAILANVPKIRRGTLWSDKNFRQNSTDSDNGKRRLDCEDAAYMPVNTSAKAQTLLRT